MHGFAETLGRIVVVASLSGLAPALTACGGANPAMEKKVRALSDELVRVQNAQDRLEERLAGLESRDVSIARAAEPAKVVPRQDELELGERPDLHVVALRPEGPAPTGRKTPALGAPDEAADEAERPLIRAQGDKVLSTGVGDGRAQGGRWSNTSGGKP